ATSHGAGTRRRWRTRWSRTPSRTASPTTTWSVWRTISPRRSAAAIITAAPMGSLPRWTGSTPGTANIRRWTAPRSPPSTGPCAAPESRSPQPGRSAATGRGRPAARWPRTPSLRTPSRPTRACTPGPGGIPTARRAEGCGRRSSPSRRRPSCIWPSPAGPVPARGTDPDPAHAAARAGRDASDLPAAGLLLPAVSLYAAALCTMAMLATGLGRRGALGGALFVLSDALIALDTFAVLPLPAQGFWVMLTYLLAQVLLVSAVLSADRKRAAGGPGAGRRPPAARPRGCAAW